MEDSLKKRYIYKLGTGLIGLPIYLVTQAIVPRALGPAAYGNYNFLTNFFAQVVSFFDAGTSFAFYTKLSQRQHESGLIRFYWRFAGLVGAVVMAGVLCVLLWNKDQFVWPEQESKYVWMAVAFGLFQWCTQIINKIVDAYGLTVSGEIKRLQQRVLALGLLIIMFVMNRLSLTEFFAYQYVVFLILCVVWTRELRKHSVHVFPTEKLATSKLRGYIQEFYSYSSPLIAYGFTGLIAGLLERWMLQKFAGSEEQGYYGLSYQIGAVYFVIASSMTPLIMREFSIAFADHNFDKMRSLFQRYIPMLPTVVAYFGVFIAVQAENVSLTLGGRGFHRATLAVSIMALYPILQTYGQLSGSLFYATGQTRVYRNLELGVMVIGLLVAYFLIAPADMFGLGLGASGLAIKMITVAFFEVNLQLWFNARFLGLSFSKFLWHQVYPVLLLSGFALGATKAMQTMITSQPVALLTSGIMYTLGCVGLLLCVPSMFSLSRSELMHLFRELRTSILKP